MFENFWGNRAVTESLEQMIGGQRLSQTLLFSGREGVGKATLARRMAARLLGHRELIEKDDLALPENLKPSRRARSGPPRSATKTRSSSPRIPISSPSPPMVRCARSRFRRRACSRKRRNICRTRAPGACS